MATRTGLVLAGAAARGAYEAGALSVLLPVLDQRGEQPRILAGTSVGALNATFLASRAHLPGDVAAKELVALWKDIGRKDVFHYAPFALPALVGQELGLLAKPSALVDTSPLRDTVNAAIGDWSQIRRNIKNGHIDALAVATTSASTGRTVVFVEGGIPRRNASAQLPPHDVKKAIDYVKPFGGLDASHVLASAAVPIVFPPVEVALSKVSKDWFVDGGIRLNTPIKPAIKLGANRIAIVATDPALSPTEPSATPAIAPDWDDLMLHMLQASLADPLVEDMWRLAGINRLLGDRASAGRVRRIEYLFVGPEARGELGAIAGEVTEALTFDSLKLLSWVIGRQGTQRNELMSYFLFHPKFFEKAMACGADHARREMRRLSPRGPGWRTEPMRVP